MKWLAPVCAALLTLVPPAPASGQAYAPATEYHDRIQRHFVVEGARILGWLENGAAGQAKIVGIKYSLAITPDRNFIWKLQWLDAAGAAVREKTVNYAESALLDGPGWYRQVATQLGLLEVPMPAAVEADVSKSYWAGAELSQPSRAESLRAVLALAPGREPARAAGLLTHTALPCVVTPFSLDSVLLARGAAWLCVAEHAVARPSPQLEALWAPTLFLAGRENAASGLWKKAAPGAASALGQWWAFLLSQPRSQAVFAFAADPRYRRWAMPLLAYQCERFHLASNLPEVLMAFSTDRAFIFGLHDYGPWLARESGVSGGRILEGYWPVLSRAAWGETLRLLKPEAPDYAGYLPKLEQWKPKPAAPAETDDPSVAGLAEAAPVLNLGFPEGTVPLIPTGTVTARDLLRFGWEMSAFQMAARWHFVSYMWGVSDLADGIARKTLPVLEGSEAFFDVNPNGSDLDRMPGEVRQFFNTPRLRDLRRLQELSGPAGLNAGPMHRFDSDRKLNAQIWARRCWLRPDVLWHQGMCLYFAEMPEALAPLLTRERSEGGPLTEAAELRLMARQSSKIHLSEAPGLDALRRELVAALAEPSAGAGQGSWEDRSQSPPFERAQEQEKVFWQRPGGDLPYAEIFADYLRGHAVESAKRFYREAGPLIADRVSFSSRIGPARFILALFEEDRPAMLEAMTASATGSSSDMQMSLMAAALAGDDQGLERQVDEHLERYPPSLVVKARGDSMSKLKGFVPLLPALRDPAHPRHAEAVDYFGSDRRWSTLQWILASRAKLTGDEAVRFFGGLNTDPERRLYIDYLRGDREEFESTLKEILRPDGKVDLSTMGETLVILLRNKLLAPPVPGAQPDLKPPQAQGVLDAFREAFERLNPRSATKPNRS